MPELLRSWFDFDKIEYEQDMAALKLLEEKERKSKVEDITLPPLLLVANKCEEGFDVNPIYDSITDIWKYIDA